MFRSSPKYYLFFNYFLQEKMDKTGKKTKENHTIKVTKILKSKRQKYGMNKTKEDSICKLKNTSME